MSSFFKSFWMIQLSKFCFECNHAKCMRFWSWFWWDIIKIIDLYFKMDSCFPLSQINLVYQFLTNNIVFVAFSNAENIYHRLWIPLNFSYESSLCPSLFFTLSMMRRRDMGHSIREQTWVAYLEKIDSLLPLVLFPCLRIRFPPVISINTAVKDRYGLATVSSS